MKRVVKLSIIIFCIAFLFGCSGTSEGEAAKPSLSVAPVFTPKPTGDVIPTEKPVKTDIPTEGPQTPMPSAEEPYSQDDMVFEISSVSPFFDEDAVNLGYNYSGDYSKWTDEIEDRFGIKLKVTDLFQLNRDIFIYYSSDNSEIYENIKSNISNGTIKGLFRLGAPTYLTKLIYDDLILPLDQYLKNNLSWQSLPDDYKEAFRVDGVTYGIPSGSYDKAYTRFIRKDWLDLFGLDMPTTIDEFYYAAKKFTYDDPDGSGGKNTSGFTHYGTRGIEDIFASFDVRMNPDGKLFITWNPNNNKWEDGMLKPEMVECMEFLRNCRIETVLVRNTYLEGQSQFERGITGSYCSYSSYYSDVEDDIRKNSPESTEPKIAYISGMSHLIEENITGYHTFFHSPMVMTKESRYPETTINTLVNVFITDEAGFLLGRFGPEGEAFEMIDNLLVYKTVEENGRRYAYQGPQIVYQSPHITYSKVADFIYDSGVYDETKADDYSSRERMEAVRAAYTSYKIPWKVVFPDYSDSVVRRLGEMENKTRNLTADILGGMMSFEEGLTEYKYLARAIGMQEFLNMQNEKLGTLSDQIY